jgi:hypothetical protein
MPMFLTLIGILVALVGFMTIGFAVPNRDFDLGHSLIITGMIAVVGGLIVIGLGAVVREIRRSARTERPVQAAKPAAAEPVGKALGKMPLPTPTPPVVAAPRGGGRAEPRLDLPEQEAAGGPRPDIFATIRTGREPMPEAEEVPLSPTQAPRVPRPEGEEMQPRTGERRPLSPAALASRTAARIDTPREPPRSERSARNLFDSVWPTETPRRAPEPARPSPLSEPPVATPERKEARVAPEPRLEPPPLRAEPPPMRAEPPAPPVENEPAREEPRPLAILKSGVIDGMAYTLYTDGSIEAQLPKGMMRFASIDELRQYLEKNS